MVDQRREVGVKVRSVNVFRIEDPTGLAKLDHQKEQAAARARERAANAEERAARMRKVSPRYAGGYHGPGTPDFGGQRKDVANMKMEKEQRGKQPRPGKEQQ